MLPIAALIRAASYVSLSFAVAAFLGIAWIGSQLPPIGTDGLIYHLTLPAHWLRAGYLAPVDLPFHDGAAEHSPMLTESIFHLLMRLTGDDGLTWLVQPAFHLISCRLYFLSVRLCGLSADGARFATAAVVLFPPFWMSASLANADLALVCGAALFCYGVLLGRIRPGRGPVVAAAGIAVMLSAKYIGVAYAGAAVPVLVASVLLGRKPASGPGRRLLPTAAASAAVVAAGCGFHLLNWARHGNPVFPAEISLGGFRLFPGLYRSSVLIDHGWSLSALVELLVHSAGAFGVILPVSLSLWVGAFGTLAAAAGRRLRRRDAGPLLVGLAFPALATLLYLAVNPFWREHRLLFPVYYALLVGSGFGFTLPRRFGKAAAWAAAGAAAVFAAYVLAQVLPFFHEIVLMAGGAGAAAGLALAAMIRPGRRPRWLKPATAALAAVGLWWVLTPSSRADRYEQRGPIFANQYGARGEAWQVIEEMTAGRGATVACSGTAVTFPLFGSRLQNWVVYVPVGPNDRPTPVDLRPGDSVYDRLAAARRAEPDETFWLDGLRRRRVDLVLLVAEPGGELAELGFVERSPELFTPVFARDGVFVYQFAGGN